MRAALLTPLALGLLAAPAHATSEPPWFKVETASSPHALLSEPAIAVGRDNTVLAAWGWQDGTGPGARAGDHAAAQRSGALDFDPERALPAGRVGGPLLFGGSQAALALVRPAGSNRHPRSQVRVAFGTSAGAFRASRLVARRPRIARPALAGNGRGDLALAWFEDRGTRNDRVAVSLRRRGRAFGAPTHLATGRVRTVAAAVGARGHVLVAWEARGVVRARFRRPGARRFGPAETVRSRTAVGADLHAAVAPSGRAYLAWSAQRRTEGGESGPGFVQAAARRPGGRFARARLLERLAAAQTAHPVDLDVDSRGRALVGWTGASAEGERPRLAESTASGAFIALAVPSTGVLADVATGPDGRRLALWISSRPPFGRAVMSAVDHGRGGGFGAPEIASQYGDVHSARGAIAASGFAVAAHVSEQRLKVAYRRPG